MPRPWSIRWWLGTFAAAVTLPPLALLAWVFATQIQREQLDARDTALRIARATAMRMLTLHHDSQDLLERMAARPAIREFDGKTCDSLFPVVDFFPQFPDLMLFDANGSLVCSATSRDPGDAFARATQSWVSAELHAGRLVPDKPVIRAIDSRWVTVLTRQVRRADGTLAATLALVEFAKITGLMPTKKDLIDSAGAIGRGTILARSNDPALWSGRNVRGTGVAALALRYKEGRSEAIGVDGVRRQYGYTSIPELGWLIYAGVPTDVVMQPVRDVILRGAVGMLLVTIIVIALAAYFARSIAGPINAVARAAHEMARGSYETIERAGGPREMVVLAEAFNDMVTRRARAEAEMHASELSLKALSDRLLVVQEEERTRIARELHDDLGQSLTALKMDVGGLLAAQRDSETIASIRDRIVRTLDATVTSVQRISSELRPPLLDDLGLAPALEAESRLFEERTGIECELSLPHDVTPLGGERASALYRIMQEALTNVARHSDATRVEIRLRYRPDAVLLEVRDDGRGITPRQIHDPVSHGLIGMRERAAIVGGTLNVEGIAGRGTIVTVRIPHEPVSS